MGRVLCYCKVYKSGAFISPANWDLSQNLFRRPCRGAASARAEAEGLFRFAQSNKYIRWGRYHLPAESAQVYRCATCRVRRPRRTADATAARYKIVEFIIYPRVLQQSNILYLPRFDIIFLFEKEKQTRGFTPRPRNAVQQYIVRGS